MQGSESFLAELIQFALPGVTVFDTAIFVFQKLAR